MYRNHELMRLFFGVPARARPALSLCGLGPLRKPPRFQSNRTPYTLVAAPCLRLALSVSRGRCAVVAPSRGGAEAPTYCAGSTI
jgi:hypothetical protein